MREDVYECLADLQGFELSTSEMVKALIRVGKLFDRGWKQLEDEEDTFDLDTL